MNNNKNKNKDNHNQPGPRGMFYYQKKCFSCGRLMWGNSPKNRRAASKDAYFKMKAHSEQHQKDKQLKFLPKREDKQSQTISRVTLRGEKKSV